MSSRPRLISAAVAVTLLTALAVAWTGFSKTPANAAQGMSQGTVSNMVSVAADGKGNVVLAYPNGVVAIVKPQGATQSGSGGFIHVYQISPENERRADVKVIRALDSRALDAESGELYDLPKASRKTR